jgi:hypothetical protein
MRFAFDDDESRDSSEVDDADETDLDRDFPLGDGTADTSADVICPYCGETNTVGVDPGSGDDQSYVEDCQVCCQPWRVSVHYRTDGTADITATALDD